jgi:hypothetical protein
MASFRTPALTALALCLALTLPAVAAEPVRTAAPAGGFEKYLPDGAEFVVAVNVHQFLDSELVKKAGLDKALANADDKDKESLALLGIDPLKDIDRLIITADKLSLDDLMFIMQGKFDREKLSAAMDVAVKKNKEMFKIHKCEHGRLCEVCQLDEVVKVPKQGGLGPPIDLKGKSFFIAVPDANNVVFTASKETAENVLARGAGKQTGKLNRKELADLIGKMNPKQTVCVAWPKPFDQEKLKSITGGVTVASDIKLDLAVNTSGADAAKEVDQSIGDGLQQAKDFVGFLGNELSIVQDILGDVKHEAKDSTVTVKTDIKAETLQKLAKVLGDFAKKQGGIR